MRTTLTLFDDVAQKAKALAHRLKRPYKEVLNAALRLGIEEMERPRRGQTYRTKPRPLGLREGLSYDNVQELLARAESEDFR